MVNLITLIKGIITVLVLLHSRFSGWVQVNVAHKRISCNLWLLSHLLLTYLHTSWNRVLLEKLTDPHNVKKLSAFYGTRRFISAFTRARHLSLS